MRFTADYDSEEEEFPVSDVKKPLSRSTSPEGDSEDDDSEYIDTSWNFSPKANREAWLAISQKDKEISELNALHARSAAKTYHNSIILDNLETTSITSFLHQLTLDDQSRAQSRQTVLQKTNSDVLDAITKAISIAKTREEEQRRKAEEEQRTRAEAERRERARWEEERREWLRREEEQREQVRRDEERQRAVEAARQAEEERKAAARTEAEERARLAGETARLAKEQEKARQAEEIRRKAETDARRSSAATTSEPSSSAQAEFEAHLALIESIKTKVLKPCSENPEWKTACFQLKRKITSRLGQLTNSRRQISRLVKDLLDVFEKGKSIHETVLMWLLNFFSKEVVVRSPLSRQNTFYILIYIFAADVSGQKQAESEVIVQIPAAFPLAYVSIFLISKFPSLKPILLARFAKNCPWTVPFYTSPQSEDAMKKMGYKRTEDSKWEEQSRYIERQSGILAVYAAMTTHQLSPRAVAGTELTPYGLANAWRWVARCLNHVAGGEIEVAMMATFLEVANQAILRVYGRQAVKLVMVALGEEWSRQVERGPAKGRLEIMKDEFERTGRIGEEGFGSFVP